MGLARGWGAAAPELEKFRCTQVWDEAPKRSRSFRDLPKGRED